MIIRRILSDISLVIAHLLLLLLGLASVECTNDVQYSIVSRRYSFNQSQLTPVRLT
jgi:hypothetical protein